MGIGRSAGARESTKEIIGVSAPAIAPTLQSVGLDDYGPPVPANLPSAPQPYIAQPAQPASAPPPSLSVTTPGAEQDTIRLGPQYDNSYSMYQPSALGTLQDFFAKQQGANVIDGRLYIKPEDYSAAQAKIKALTNQQLTQYQPMIGGNLPKIGEMGGQTYYDAAEFNKRMDPFYAIDLTPWAGRSETAKAKPVTTIDGETYYMKRDLAPLTQMKTYYSDIDPLVQKLIGNAYGTDAQGAYVTGLVNPKAFQIGVGDYGTEEIGGGKYNILDKSGKVLGVGYDPVREAANELFTQNELNKELTKIKPGIGNSYSYGGVTYPTLQDAQAAAKAKFDFNAQKDEWRGGQGFGGKLADWEVLGQALQGSASPAGLNQWGSLPLNFKSEKVAGENTLYGSTPIFYNGKLLGYQSDLAAAPSTYKGSSGGGQDKSQWNPFGYQATHNGKSHAWSTGLSRDINPEAYKGLVQGLGGSEIFVPTSNVSQLPGWTNKEGYKHQDRHYGAMASSGGWGEGLRIVGDIAGMATTGVPWGSIAAAGISGVEGDNKGLEGYLKNAGMQYLGGQLGDVTGTGNAILNQAAGNAIMQGAGSLLQGQDFGEALKSAAIGGATGYLGGQLGQLAGDAVKSSGLTEAIGKTGTQIVNKGISGLTSGALGAALQKGDVGQGALLGGLSGLGSGALSQIARQYGIGSGISSIGMKILLNSLMQQQQRQRVRRKG